MFKSLIFLILFCSSLNSGGKFFGHICETSFLTLGSLLGHGYCLLMKYYFRFGTEEFSHPSILARDFLQPLQKLCILQGHESILSLSLDIYNTMIANVCVYHK